MYYKKTIFFMIMALFALNSAVFSQNISLKMKDVTIKQAIGELKNKTGYSFVYSVDDLDTQKHISVSVQDKKIDEAIKQILNGQNLSYEIKGKNIIVKRISNGIVDDTKLKVAGIVVDENNMPLVGASIVVLGTTNSTITDAAGKFSLEIPANESLVVSFIGYDTQIVKIQGKSSLTIKLVQQTKSLNEVVVIGYTSQKKELMSSSIATVKVAEGMKDLAIQSSAELLTGKMAGIRVNAVAGKPGSQSSVSIRTASSWNSQPVLYVIDGMIYNSTISGASGANVFQNLSPSEIESITVLKDAAAAAVYGARAAGGVLIVNTNRGKTGKPTINYSFNYSADVPTQEVALTNLYESGVLTNQMYKNMGQTAPVGTAWSADELDWAKALPGHGYDGLKAVWKTPFIKNHSISISGGTES